MKSKYKENIKSTIKVGSNLFIILIRKHDFFMTITYENLLTNTKNIFIIIYSFRKHTHTHTPLLVRAQKRKPLLTGQPCEQIYWRSEPMTPDSHCRKGVKYSCTCSSITATVKYLGIYFLAIPGFLITDIATEKD